MACTPLQSHPQDDRADRGQPCRRIQPLQASDLDRVMDIEARAYAFPWSRGNFVDSLVAGHRCIGLWLSGSQHLPGRLAAYCVSMAGVEERHLLNLTVESELQGQGHGRCLIDDLVAHSLELGEARLWLEVRASNERALKLYRRYGFQAIGKRRGYYPDGHSRREDAVVMSYDVQARAAAGGSG